MKRRRRPHERGMTLIELLVVVTILGMIATIVGISVNEAMQSARENTARIQIENYGQALDLYKVKFYRYPSSAEGLVALRTPPRGDPLVKEIADDPWGVPYVYTSPGTEKREGFELYSKGRDSQEGTGDDIR